MNFYLMRHAEAEDGPREDPTRALTSVGRKQAQLMGDFLVRQIGRVDIVLTSYFDRARGTAAPIAEALGCEMVVDTPMLEPEVKPKEAWAEIQFIADGMDDVLVVTHHPLVNDLLAFLTGSKSAEFKHAAVAKIKDGELHWLVPPHVVERDEDEVIEAALEVSAGIAGLHEARTRKTGLLHKRHQATLAGVRTKLKKLFAGYFKRQGAAIMEAVKPNIQRAISQYSEARGSGKRFATTLVPKSLHPLTFGATDDETGEFNAAIKAAIEGAGITLAKELKAKGTLGPNVAEDYLREHSLEKLTGGFADTTIERLRNSIADAWDEGGNFDQIVGAIKGTMEDFSTTRAEMIAQTEANDAYNTGRMAMAAELDMDEKAWDPAGDACEEICQPNADQGWIPIDEDFESGDDAPTAHPNCFLAGTLVSAGGITGAVCRWYEGEILHISVGADTFSVTPNHPILGADGWTRARELQCGDRVVQCVSPSRAAAILDPNNHHIETRIEEIADSLFVTGGMAAYSMPVSAEAFHGDSSPNRKVDIVRAAGALPRDWTEGRENGEYNSFGLRHSSRVSFLEQGDFLAMLKGLDLAAHSIVSSHRSGVAQCFGHGGGAQQPSLAHTALLETDGIPAAHDSNTTDADSLRDMQHRLSGLMRLVQISKIDVVKFTGHVYNLETKDGIYFANSIVAHNCDCSIDFRKSEGPE